MKISILLASAILLSGSGIAHSADFTLKTEDGNILYFEITKKGVAPTAVSGSKSGEARVTYASSSDAGNDVFRGEVVLPPYVKHHGIVYEIVEVGPKAFSGAKNLNSVVIPLTVERIAPFAFENCTSLARVDFPSEEVEVDENSFFGCDKLSDISFGEDWKVVDLSPYKWSESLTDVVLPYGMTSFSGLEELLRLENIEIAGPGKNDASNLYSAKEGCLYKKGDEYLVMVPSGVRGEFEIPEGTKYISSDAFGNCPGIEKIIIPGSVKTLPVNVVSDVESLKGIKVCGEKLVNGSEITDRQKNSLALKVWNEGVVLEVPSGSADYYRMTLYSGGKFKDADGKECILDGKIINKSNLKEAKD